MNSKRNKITLLKQKILDMKQQLNQMATPAPQTNSIRKLQPSPSPHRPSSTQKQKPPINKSSSFIYFKPASKEKDLSNHSRHQSREKQADVPKKRVVTEQDVAPKLKQLSYSVSQQYYQSEREPERKKSVSKANVLQIVQNVDSRYYSSAVKDPSERQNGTPRKHLKSIASLTNISPVRPEKIKTYNLKPSNPILNPQAQRLSMKKLVKDIQPSPKKLLTEHPQFNEKLHFFGTKGVIVERKGALSNSKNKSSIPFSEARLEQKSPTPGGRKHFSHKFAQNY